jgi:hypothetical protein
MFPTVPPNGHVRNTELATNGPVSGARRKRGHDSRLVRVSAELAGACHSFHLGHIGT